MPCLKNDISRVYLALQAGVDQIEGVGFEAIGDAYILTFHDNEKHRFRVTLEQLPDAVWVKDGDSNVART